MQAFTRSVFDLFSAKKRYLVPMFQRPYVWGRERQWEPLWEDIRTKAQEHLEGNEVDPHFLGAIVINQIRTFGAAIPAHEIIDGQQRLTTFQLFLAAFRDIAVEFDDPEISAELASYTLNTGKKAGADEEFKIWPTRSDQPAFSHTLKAGSKDAIEAAYPPVLIRKKLQPRHRLVEAYLFFQASIRDFLTEGPPEEADQRLQALFSALQNSLQLVSIELETKDDPQVIFETLNARGEPLLSSDLLRNFIFLRAKREDLSSDDLYDAYWQPFDVEPAEDGDPAKFFWKIEERQGRLSRPRLDLFIQHFLSLKTGRDVNVGRLFHDYRHWIEKEKPYTNVEAELKELKRYSRVFSKFFVPEPETPLGKFILRLQRLLDTNTVFPFLLYLEADSGIPLPERSQILKDLESYLVRRMVCGLTEKAYNTLFLQLMRNLRDLESPSAMAFRGILLGLAGESRAWPDDSKFAEAWLNQPIYRASKSSARIETMLRAIEEFEVDGRREQIRVLTPLTIEHVMPQEWEEHWPLPNSADALASKLERDTLIHTFGNLTLLTNKLNSSVSNASFPEKRSAIIKESALRLNTHFQDIENWDEPSIKHRGAILLRVATQVWPFPTSTTKSGGEQSQHPSQPEADSPISPLPVLSTSSLPTPLKMVQLEYWTAFVAFIERMSLGLKPAKPYPQNWIYLAFHPGGFKFEATIVAKHPPRISCGLTIQRPDALMILSKLEARRAEIEANFGSHLDWTSRNENSKIECHVQAHWEGASFLNVQAWPDQFKWISETLSKLQIAFYPIVAATI